jgi:ABC-type glycerol-3-phosphate transport system permease component
MSDALTDFIIKPSAPFAAGVVLFGVVWGFFKGVESVLTDDTKLEIAVWLVGVKTADKVPWPDTFAKVFDRVFGTKHLSWKCFWRSCIASLTLASLSLCISSNGAWPFFRPIKAIEITFGILLFTNIIPDYVSLLETRYMLRWTSERQAIGLWIAALVSDFIASTFIAVVGVWLGNALFEYAMGVSSLRSGISFWTVPIRLLSATF